MADVEVHGAEIADGRIRSLKVRFKNADERTVDRATALRWIEDGHSLVVCSGHGHHVHRGGSIVRVEVGEEPFLRTDTKPEASDAVAFPAHGH